MSWPLLVYFVFVIVLVAAVLAVSYLLGQRHSEPATGEPYEGGIVSEGSAHVRFSDALLPDGDVLRCLRSGSGLPVRLGRSGSRSWLGWLLGSCCCSSATLGAALLYVWRVGALDWSKKPRSFEVRIACSGH